MDKVVSVSIQKERNLQPAWIVFNEDEKSIKRIILYEQFLPYQDPVYYDYIEGEAGVESYIPHLNTDQFMAPLTGEQLTEQTSDSEACISCIVEDWAKLLRKAASILGMGIVIYGKVGAVLILARAGSRWQSAQTGIASTSAAWNQQLGNTPGLTGKGQAATLLQRAQQGAKWLRRAGYGFAAIAVIAESYSVWVETRDWKATLTTAAHGTAEVIALVALAKGVAWGLATLAVITGFAAAAPIAAAVAIAVGTFAIVTGIYAAWKYFEVEDLIFNLARRTAGYIASWWQRVMEFMGNAVNRLATAVEWSFERLANHSGFSLMPENYIP